MKEKIIALPVLMAMWGGTAYAADPTLAVIKPLFNEGSNSVNLNQDYAFRNHGLDVNLSRDSGSGYVLTVTGAPANNVTFNLQGGSQFSATASYSLWANFNSDQVFTGGNLKILGNLNPGSIFPSNITAPASNVLYDADLTVFNTHDNVAGDNQYTLGFRTSFNPSWSNQIGFTGGSTGELVYLYPDALNLATSPLKQLVDAFNTGGGLAALTSSGAYSVNGAVNSIATVPVPMPAVLFGTGITALLGFGRQNRKNSKSI